MSDYDDRLRAAAEQHRQRLSRLDNGETMVSAEEQEALLDMIVLSTAYLAEHPADDAVPVTAQWLGLGSDRGQRTFDGPGQSLTIYMGYCVEDDGQAYGRWCALIGNGPFSCAVRVPARGHVRRLAAAVGILTLPAAPGGTDHD